MLLVQAGFGSDVQLTQRDADALADEFNAPDVLRVSPVVNATGTTFVNGQETYEPSSVVGTVPAYAQTRSYDVLSGAMFTAEDVSRHRRVRRARADGRAEPVPRRGPGRAVRARQRHAASRSSA